MSGHCSAQETKREMGYDPLDAAISDKLLTIYKLSQLVLFRQPRLYGKGHVQTNNFRYRPHPRLI